MNRLHDFWCETWMIRLVLGKWAHSLQVSIQQKHTQGHDELGPGIY